MANRPSSPSRDISNSLRIPHSPPPKEGAPGVGASGVKSRSGGMSFTVGSEISRRNFHASNNEEPKEDIHQLSQTQRVSNRNINNRESDIAESSKESADALVKKTELTKEQLWAHVFHNVNRAVDELYYLCEAEENDCPSPHTEEAVKLMIKNSRDFEKLIERFQAQKEYEVNNRSASCAWEVRKTANSTPPLCAAFVQSNEGEGGQSSMGDHVIRHALETMEEKARLERTTTTSTPTTTIPSSNKPSIITSSVTVKPQAALSPSSSLSSMMGNHAPTPQEAKPLSARERRNKRRAENATKAHSPARPLVSLDPPVLMATPSPRIQNPSHKSHTSSSRPKEPDQESEEILETEKVWAVAEAWVEAEAAAEELAWERLQRGDVSLSMLEADEKVREAMSLARGSPAEWLISGDSDAGSGSEDDEQIVTQKQAKHELEEEEEVDEEEIMDFDAEDEEDIMDFGSAEEEVEEMEAPQSPTVVKTESTSRPSFKRSGSGSEVDALMIGRAMHTKLSSPTRHKPSPAMTEAKTELKHDKAKQNREMLETNRKLRLEEAAQKAAQVKIKIDKQQLATEVSHFNKLTEGGRRHAVYIENIRSKAENENIKVEEVLFINGLTAAGIKNSLDDRLREVEARIEQGKLKKQVQMEARKEHQRKKENMVSLRLRNNEQLAGERWLKLQNLIEDVGRRRKDRLDEIARRKSEKASASSSSSSNSGNNGGGGASSSETIAPFATSSESLPSTPLPTPLTRPAQLKKSHSLPHQTSRDDDLSSVTPTVTAVTTSATEEVSSTVKSTNELHHDHLPSHVRKCVSLEEEKGTSHKMSKSFNPMSASKEEEIPLKTNSRSHHLKSKSPVKSRNQTSTSPVPLALPGSLAAASFWESNTSAPSVVGRELRRRDSEREAATRSAGLDDGASVFAPNAEPIDVKNNQSSASTNTNSSGGSSSATSAAPNGLHPNKTHGSFKRKDSRNGSFKEGGGRGRKGNTENKNDDDGGEGVANRGKKLRKLRTKLLRLAPGWNESRWGCGVSCAHHDSWSTPVVGEAGAATSSPSPPAHEVLNSATRTRLDRSVDALRRFRDKSNLSSSGGKGNKNKLGSPALGPQPEASSVAELETSLHDLGRLLSDLSMGVGASSSAQSIAVQRRIRESGGLELLQQLTAPRHGAFNSIASPLALDALSLCFAGQSTQCDFVLASDAGVGVVDAATYALETVISAESGLDFTSSSPSSDPSFGTTPGSSRSLASLSAMVERASQPVKHGKKATESSTSTSSSVYSQAGNPWETLNTTILLLMHLLRHSASNGLEEAQESMVRFLCVTGFLQDLVTLLNGDNGYCSIAAVALGTQGQGSPSNSPKSSDNKRYQLLTSVEARTLLRRSIALLEAVAAFPLVSSSDPDNSTSANVNNSLHNSVRSSITSLSTANVDGGRAASGVRRLFEETSAGNLLSMLEQVMEHGITTSSTTPCPPLQTKMSDESVELCLSGLAALNNIARLDLDLFQNLLPPHKVQIMCNHLFSSFSLNKVSSSSGRMNRLNKSLLSECVVFIGFYVLNKPSHQQLLLESMSVYNRDQTEQKNKVKKEDMTLLGELLVIPRQSNAEVCDIMPTLLAATYKNEQAQEFIGSEMMTELHQFIETNAEAMHTAKRGMKAQSSQGNDANMKVKMKIEVVDSTTSQSAGMVSTGVKSAFPPYVALSHRFPVEFWMGKDGFSVHSDRCSEAV